MRNSGRREEKEFKTGKEEDQTQEGHEIRYDSPSDGTRDTVKLNMNKETHENAAMCEDECVRKEVIQRKYFTPSGRTTRQEHKLAGWQGRHA